MEEPVTHWTERYMAKNIMDHLYQNMNFTGSEQFSNGVKETDKDDDSWKENGVMLKFN